MAKYTVERACGHTETVVLFGKNKDREWRLERVEPSKLCYECYQKELARKREEENRESAEAAKEMNLPTLTGTEKQVAWAETIRQRIIGELEKVVYSVPQEKRDDQFIRVVEALESIKAITAASWWIDNRFAETKRALVGLVDEEMKAIKTEQAQPPKEVVADAKAEATVRPESPKTETVAEIRVTESVVEVIFPEKRDDFRELVKEKLHMSRSGSSWKREIKMKNGTPADRAAEAGHRLLAAGFSIRIYDSRLREKAVSGDYEQECTRWVTKFTSGKHEGCFYISWDKNERNWYDLAKKIAGSRYDKPGIAVPPESFEEVLDFAKLYVFKLSEGAQEAVEAARLVKEKALVVNVELPDDVTVLPGEFPPVLEVPQRVGIADEFMD